MTALFPPNISRNCHNYGSFNHAIAFARPHRSIRAGLIDGALLRPRRAMCAIEGNIRGALAFFLQRDEFSWVFLASFAQVGDEDRWGIGSIWAHKPWLT